MLWIEPDSGRIVDANEAASQFYGHSVAELRQRRIQDINLLTPQQVAEERALAAAQNRSFFIFPHRLADGQVRTVEVRSVPYQVHGQTLLLSFIHDLSAQRLPAHEQWRYPAQLEAALARQRASIDEAHRQRQLLLGALVLLLAAATVTLAVTAARARRLAAQTRQQERATHEALLREREALGRLAQTTRTLDQIVHGTELATWDWDLRQDTLDVNDRWLMLVGHTAASLPTLDTARWHALLHPTDRTLFEHAWARHLSGQRPLVECELRLQHRAGHWVTVLLRGQVVQRDADGVPLRAVGILLDVSAQRQQQQALALAEQVFNHTHEAILVTDTEGRIVRVNEAFCRLTGYASDEVLGRTPAVLTSGRHDAAFFAGMWQTLHACGSWSGEIWNRRRDGSLMANWMAISTVRGPDGSAQAYVGLFHDITARKHDEAELQRAALYDALTGLGNRVLLQDRLEQAMARSARHGTCLAVAMLDLDGFKAVNDTHGHATGDRLLVALAQRLRATVREADTVVRLGGDEFVVLLPDLSRPEDARPLVQRLLDVVARPVDDPVGPLQVSASAGLTYHPQAQPADGAALLQQADQAMYEAKRAGRNRYAEWHPAPPASRDVSSPAGNAGAYSQPW